MPKEVVARGPRPHPDDWPSSRIVELCDAHITHNYAIRGKLAGCALDKAELKRLTKDAATCGDMRARLPQSGHRRATEWLQLINRVTLRGRRRS